MAAPSATVRGTPAGKQLEDGWSTKITCSRNTMIKFWEREVKPPGWKVGDKINLTSMHNTRFMTGAPPRLVDTNPGNAKVLYDPAVIEQIRQDVGQPQTFTFRFSDGTTDAMYGYIESFDPDPCVPGQEPLASIVFQVTNYDATNDVEAGPVLAEVAGS